MAKCNQFTALPFEGLMPECYGTFLNKSQL